MSEATSIRIRRAIAGDDESIGWLVAHFDPLVIAQVRMRLGPATALGQEIRDVVDEVWLATLGKLEELRPREGRLSPVLVKFLITASFNACNNALRRAIADRGRRAPANAARMEATPTIASLAARQEGAMTQASFREISAKIGAALDSLDGDKVEVLVLRLLEQRSNAEIATMLGIPRNTIAVRYRRALEDLRAALPPTMFRDLLDIRRT